MNNYQFKNTFILRKFNCACSCYMEIPLANASSAETPPIADDPLGKISGVSASKRIWAWFPVVWNVRFLFLCADIVKWPSSRNMTDLGSKCNKWTYWFSRYEVLYSITNWASTISYKKTISYEIKFHVMSTRISWCLHHLLTNNNFHASINSEYSSTNVQQSMHLRSSVNARTDLCCMISKYW